LSKYSSKMACLMRPAVGARALFARATVHSVAFSRVRFVPLPSLAWGPPFLHVKASRRVSHLRKGASGLVCSGGLVHRCTQKNQQQQPQRTVRMNHKTVAKGAHALDTASPGKNCHLQMSLLAIYTYTHAHTHTHTQTHMFMFVHCSFAGQARSFQSTPTTRGGTDPHDDVGGHNGWLFGKNVSFCVCRRGRERKGGGAD